MLNRAAGALVATLGLGACLHLESTAPPERPQFVEMLAARLPYYRQRLAVKPGITGWAQINHKYGDSEFDARLKLEYDLYYIKHLAPALDFFNIFHTLKVMVLQRGAQ